MFNTRKLLSFFCVLCFSVSACTAPEKDPWPRWQAYNPASQKSIDHSLWQHFLTRYVITNNQDVNLIKYSSVTAEDKKLLKQYLDKLSGTDIDNYNKSEQLAYWINLYNALTIYTVLTHYPVKSILKINISPGWFSFGPWGAKLINVEGVPLSLNDIEHRMIRPIWNDPRTHYALNCASYSCPNLQKIAYTGKNINLLLDTAAHEYINSRGVIIKNEKITVSKIYVWYQSDFGGTEQGVIDHLIQYAVPNLKAQLKHFHKINGSYYDWKLNDALQGNK